MNASQDSIADNLTDKPKRVRKKEQQTPYKPRLPYVMRQAMEEAVSDLVEAEKYYDEALDWLETERTRRDSLRARIAVLAPLDSRMADLVQEERDSLISIGRMEHIIARLGQTLHKLHRNLAGSLAAAQQARSTGPRMPKADAHSNGNGDGDGATAREGSG